MTVTINLVYIIAVWLYALVVTGFWVCALIRSGKDRQDGIMEQAAMGAESKQIRERAKELEEENGKLRKEIEAQKDGKRTLAEQYIKIQNEYAWYRMLVREADPKAHERASVSMYRQKGAAGSASCATEEAQNG
ncbi:MAG TPA: hypothetical protein P5533_05325 [Candidatus Cloacimonadota bacterium]|nr:hypothetical protein [Candidatus Cloacimonadota bacterium]